MPLHAARLAVLGAALVALAACGGGSKPGADAGGSTPADEQAAAANVRAAVPALQAYFTDHASYAGATAETVREYDYGLPDVQIVPSADGMAFCLASTVRSATVSTREPSGSVQPGGC